MNEVNKEALKSSVEYLIGVTNYISMKRAVQEAVAKKK